MRTLVIALTLAAALSTGIEAHAGYKKNKSYHSGEWSEDARHRSRSDRRSHYSRDTSADIDRANNCDPGGRFGGYPAWARIAFACGGDRR